MIKKRIVASVIGISLIVLNSVAAFAADTMDRPFGGFEVKVYQSKNYLPDSIKETNNQYSYIKCTSTTNVSKAIFWIASGTSSGHVKVSEDITTGISQYFNVANYTKGARYAGDSVTLGVMNTVSTYVSGRVGGVVDYE